MIAMQGDISLNHKINKGTSLYLHIYLYIIFGHMYNYM